MGRDRGARSGTSSGPGGKARSGHFTGDTHLSLLSAKNAGQTGLNRITQAVFSTSAWYAFAGQVSRPNPLLRLGMFFRAGQAVEGLYLKLTEFWGCEPENAYLINQPLIQ